MSSAGSVEAEARWVVKAFEWAADGLGDGRIADRLNEEHVAAPGITGKTAKSGWTKITFRRLLANPLYRGLLVYGRTASKDSGGRAGKRINPDGPGEDHRDHGRRSAHRQ